MEIINDFIQEADKIISFLKQDLISLRSNRISPALIEHVLVNNYGVKTPLKQVATINCSEARTLVIQPWDATLIKEIMQGIQQSTLDLNPIVQEKIIRINVPPLTEEKRKEIIKILNDKLERTRISLRNLRDKHRDKIGQQEINKEITEDDKYRLQENLDKKIDDFNRQIKEIEQYKKTEIMTI